LAARRSLSHFAVYGLEPEYWALESGPRADLAREWREALVGATDAVHFYRSFGTREGSDALVWSSTVADASDAPARFFASYGEALRPFRRFMRLRHVLWGLTAESPYSRGVTARGIDPFVERSLRYLIVYPFAKTHEWYQTSPDERRSMMTDHIQIGRGHEGIDQLLLYSTGLQDHEFVVVYETDDLGAFSDLVKALRVTEARGYTLTDAPVHVGIHVPAHTPGSLWP
jgi:chlorite dismutase